MTQSPLSPADVFDAASRPTTTTTTLPSVAAPSPYYAPNRTALALVKPHARVTRGVSGSVLTAIAEAGLRITALKTVALSREDASDFLEPYRGVMADHGDGVVQLASGTCLAVGVTGEGAVERLRAVAGPFDPAMATALYPASLRARYGVSRTLNGMHVTDAAQDGPLECAFVFGVLADGAE